MGYNPDTHESLPLTMELQHVPYEEPDKRPPRPLLKENEESTIFVGLAAFRDGARCGRTLITGFESAAHPETIRFGVVDQHMGSDPKCLNEYCRQKNLMDSLGVKPNDPKLLEDAGSTSNEVYSEA